MELVSFPEIILYWKCNTTETAKLCWPCSPVILPFSLPRVPPSTWEQSLLRVNPTALTSYFSIQTFVKAGPSPMCCVSVLHVNKYIVFLQQRAGAYQLCTPWDLSPPQRLPMGNHREPRMILRVGGRAGSPEARTSSLRRREPWERDFLTSSGHSPLPVFWWSHLVRVNCATKTNDLLKIALI